MWGLDIVGIFVEYLVFTFFAPGPILLRMLPRLLNSEFETYKPWDQGPSALAQDFYSSGFGIFHTVLGFTTLCSDIFHSRTGSFNLGLVFFTMDTEHISLGTRIVRH